MWSKQKLVLSCPLAVFQTHRGAYEHILSQYSLHRIYVTSNSLSCLFYNGVPLLMCMPGYVSSLET